MIKINIEVGEYVRTKQGTIGKVIEKYEKYCVIANTRGEIDVPYENIVKQRVKRIFEVDCIIDKSIVTKEQFSNMEYRV